MPGESVSPADAFKPIADEVAWVDASIRCTADGYRGSVTRPGRIPSTQPLLAVTERYDRVHGTLYDVTHTTSGWSCGTDFVTRGAAEAFLFAIATLVDWSRDFTDLVLQIRANGRHVYFEVRRLRAEFYRREERGDFGSIALERLRLLHRSDAKESAS